MLVKWIRCTVEPARRMAFSEAQGAWRAMAGRPGLVAQLGGWDVRWPDVACVAAWWSDFGSYSAFMSADHGGIASAQAGTYTAIEVATGSVILEMPGTGDLTDAGVLRVADCRIDPDRIDHFTAMQERVWAPGMADAPGMLGGTFAQLAPTRFLVTTGWTDLDAHAAYVEDHLPALRTAARAEADLAVIAGHVVALDHDWRVAGADGHSDG